ncbi:hypothetical protein CTAYLR_005652 [Chrysophaeum taylorii]|uniref:TauD/TfdA-like domain-containing protein n=1 Tax=Chrysophaeum taylorii TaxID=2483200 RepID=A0AAD7UKL8_9STRA|nr:hypothetical protein CTAYLR_005652 [Chrysophaeum taylorii]
MLQLGLVAGVALAQDVGGLPAKFVRENLRESFDAASLQRIVNNLPTDLEVASWSARDDHYHVVFSDGSSGEFYMPGDEIEELEDEARVLWEDPAVVEGLMGRDWKEGGISVDWAELGVEVTEAAGGVTETLNQGRARIPMAVVKARAALLRAVHVYGIAKVRNGPASPDACVRLVDAVVGAVQTSVFGYKFVIKAVENPVNLAFDNVGLKQHTDNPYQAKTPDVGVFHCISPAPRGGESLWLDGFAAAEALDEKDKQVLADTPVMHLEISDKWDLRATHPTLEYRDGKLEHVYFNERTRDSWRQYSRTKEPPSPAFYKALRTFESLVDDRARMLVTPLRAGDIALFDNSRVMHSRQAFQGGRHMEGTYMEWHSIYATYRSLYARIVGNNPMTYCGNNITLPVDDNDSEEFPYHPREL